MLSIGLFHRVLRFGEPPCSLGILRGSPDIHQISGAAVSELPSSERRLVERRKLVLLVDAGERRSGTGYNNLSSAPRRSGRDRRLGDRRVRELLVEGERREASRRDPPDRRNAGSRRMTIDRRRSSASVFTREEAGMICRLALSPGSVDCPRCTGRLTIYTHRQIAWIWEAVLRSTLQTE